MKGLTKKYLRSVEKLAARRDISAAHLARAYNASVEDPEKNEIIRRNLIEKNLKMAGMLAKRTSRTTGLDLDDLIGEGNLIICDFFSRERKLSPNFYQALYSKLEIGLKKFAVKQVLGRLSMTGLSNNLPAEDSKFIEEPKMDFQAFDGQVKEILTRIQYKVLKSRNPLYGESRPYNAIGNEIGLSGQRISQIYAGACWEIKRALGIELRGERSSSNHQTTETIYSPHVLRSLDEELIRKQGVSLSQLAQGLDFTEDELRRFVIEGSGVGRISRKNREDLFRRYGRKKEKGHYISPEERMKNLEDLRNQIIANIGMKPHEFAAYFNMSEATFVSFVKNRFPGLKEKYIRKVMRLSEEEKSQVEGTFPEKTGLNELEILDRVLHLLQSDKYSHYFPNIFTRVTERLKHAMFPIFITDQNRCISLLEAKVAEYEGTKAKQNFREVYDFFRQSRDLSIEGLRTPLDSFQSVDVLTLADKGRHILASETGVGKSLEIIATAEYLHVGKVLILTSKTSTIATWDKEIKKHLGDETVVITGDDSDKATLLTKAMESKWVVSTYETYQRLAEGFKGLQPDMVVVDEADIMNNPSSERTKAILNTNAKYKFCVSGWIFKNKRSELWPILNWLYPEEYPFREQFLKDYCKNEFGRLRLKYELSHKLIYRPKSLVLPNLPGIEQHTITVEMSGEQRAEYEAVEGNFIEWYKQNNQGRLPSGVAITKLHSLRRAALKPKFAELQGILSQRHQTPNKSVIFCSYIDEATQLADNLSKQFKVQYFDGQVGARGRQEVIDRFNTDQQQEILIMTDAGGKSIELPGANYLYLFNPVWTYSLKKQLMDRLHRRGQQRKVHVFDMVTHGTLEEGIMSRTERKREEYEKTVTDHLGYNSWFEENQESVIGSIIKYNCRKKIIYSLLPNFLHQRLLSS